MISSSHQKPYLLIYQLHNLIRRFSYTSSSLTVGNQLLPVATQGGAGDRLAKRGKVEQAS